MNNNIKSTAPLKQNDGTGFDVCSFKTSRFKAETDVEFLMLWSREFYIFILDGKHDF